MTHPLKLIAVATATAITTACAVPLGAATGGAEDAPVSCALTVTEAGRMVSVEGVVQARKAVSGSYSFDLRTSGSGGSATIRQGGPLVLSAGESATLGQSQFSGRAADVDGTLTLELEGQTLVCPMTH
ncbi:curli-like amyloid fiber formation chaperone CsgH [Roseisalinus antarcticus]|uniref:CsgH-like domain-containing protein n=1 Tax=Roseisalinus antarcticus TaxID=254357 RepID=A0A1Y5TUV1_9RHOB|nr:curli-like amyloid fiber formation chaperone CsgH [Roseisalinus antarcticus]SLN70258.1 hypothetical protein ROA7023_03441 [Roseisalinus antarcticus]